MSSNDVAIVNGAVWAMTGEKDVYEAIRWRDGQIVAIGTAEEVLRGEVPSKVIDAQGSTVLPGLIDAHAHLEMLGYSWGIATDVRSSVVSSIEDIVSVLAEAAKTKPAGEWILGQGEHYQNFRLREGRFPDAAELDRVSLDHPVVYRSSYHVNIFNNAGLRALGLDENSPDAPGGRLEHDPSTGKLTGRTYDMWAAIGGPQWPIDELSAAMIDAQRRYASAGVTTVGDIPLHSHGMEALTHMASTDTLLLRVAAYPAVPSVLAESELEEFANRFISSDRLRLAGFKVFLDGGLTSSAAALYEDYPDMPGYRGELGHTPEGLARIVQEVERLGMQIAIHAIGDRALDMAIDSIAQNSSQGDMRHRIEHAGNVFVTAERISRLKELGIVPVPQASFIRTSALGYEQHLGRARVGTLMPFRDLKDAGLKTPGNSDALGITWDQHNPFLGIQALVERKASSGLDVEPEQALSLYEAIETYTVDSAYSLRWEDKIGTLEVGKLADVVLLDGKLEDLEKDQIGNATVASTWIAGEQVFSRS